MAHPRFSAIEKLGLWFFIGLGISMVVVPPSGSVFPLFGAGIIAVGSAILLLARRRSAEPFEHRGSAEFPESADDVYRIILNDLRRTPMWRLTAVDTNLRQIDAVVGTDTWSRRAVSWTILVTAIDQDRCKVETIFRATINSAVTRQRLAADFSQRTAKYLKVGLPLLLHNAAQHGSEDRPVPTPSVNRPSTTSSASDRTDLEAERSSSPLVTPTSPTGGTDLVGQTTASPRMPVKQARLIVAAAILSVVVLTQIKSCGPSCWPESKIRQAYVGNSMRGISRVSVTSTDSKECRFLVGVTTSYDGKTDYETGKYVEGHDAVLSNGETMREP